MGSSTRLRSSRGATSGREDGGDRPQGPAWLDVWREGGARALAFQALVVVALAAAGFVVVRTTLENLRDRGISTGFGFLDQEAGFAIGEAPPVPTLGHGIGYFVLAALGGAVAMLLVQRLAAARGRSLGFPRGLLIGTLFLVVLPALAFRAAGGSVTTEVFTESSSFGLALVTGLLNTIKVAVVGWVLASVLGFAVGLARLSPNWLVRQLAAVYIEGIRNVPLLVQVFFWYFAVLRALPGVRDSLQLFGVLTVNNRGVFLPEPHGAPGLGPFAIALSLGGLGVWLLLRWARGRQARTGERPRVLVPALALMIGCPALSWAAAGQPIALSHPTLVGFNYRGGITLTPEYTALLLGLTLYTAAFIAEIVRSGIQAVARGQREAAMAIGLTDGRVLQLVVLPQALRVIIPPLTAQYLSLTKDSSLGVAIAYPEIVSVGGTVINQIGQAIEVIAIMMVIYMTLSLLTSAVMNWYNTKVKVVEG